MCSWGIGQTKWHIKPSFLSSQFILCGPLFKLLSSDVLLSDPSIIQYSSQLEGSEQSHVAGKTYSGRLEDFQRSL